MPAALTYPGVYIQEVPSGVRTITGVATSITAFVGRASAGPTDEPVMLTSFADFERRFGGLDVASPMSYTVRDFYLNGGSLALIVRVLHDDARAATIGLDDGASPSTGIVLEATSRGAWGNRLSAAIDHDTDRALPRASPPATNDQRFNLTVRDRPRRIHRRDLRVRLNHRWRCALPAAGAGARVILRARARRHAGGAAAVERDPGGPVAHRELG